MTSENNEELKDLEEQETEVTEEVDAEMVDTTSNDGELAKVQGELKTLNETYLRLYADFENFRKRTSKEKLDISSYAISDVMTKLLPIIDNFDRALSVETEKQGSFYEGMNMISKQLKDVLISEGLEKIECCGEPFDPNLHYGVQIGNEEGIKDDIILEELQTGYKYKNKVIRPAMVKVNKQ